MKPFPWRPGMLTTCCRSVIAARDGMALCSWAEGPAGAEQPRSAWFRYDLLTPDREDPATLGALLGAVREARGDPFIGVVPMDRASDDGERMEIVGWMVRGCVRDRLATGATEFEALLAAWEAAS